MFTAAGEAIAKANHMTWERLIETTIFGPLHMTSSLTSAEPPAEWSDHALGYVYREASKDWKHVPPPKSLAAMAPARPAIASTARDMCQWLRFLTAGGTIDGKRLVSEATLKEIARPHIAINDTLSYGLGWATYKWNGHTVVEHNGGSQGIRRPRELCAGPTRWIRIPCQHVAELHDDHRECRSASVAYPSGGRCTVGDGSEHHAGHVLTSRCRSFARQLPDVDDSSHR